MIMTMIVMATGKSGLGGIGPGGSGPRGSGLGVYPAYIPVFPFHPLAGRVVIVIIISTIL